MSHPVAVQAAAGSLAQSADIQQYLTFVVAGAGHPGELFGFNIHSIKEIIEYGHVTQVPMMPRYVRGVINLRGNVVPVIDLAGRFNRELSAINKRTCIVIVELQSEEGMRDVGVVVDSVCEVLEINDADIEAAPSFGARLRTEFMRGMGKVNDRFVIILNMDRVLTVDEIGGLTALCETQSEAPGSTQ